ncbi:hypothetical protein EDB85DRAFT_1968088 [Lactarius pseudohatsudake]|nr:hypothetical protein EDB85DRAFT_1968088 [Lactarius pseudohatsudake]
MRFHYFGPIEGPEAQSAVAFYDNLNGGDNADFGRIHKQIGILGGLLDGINDITKINEAVKIGRTLQYLLHLLQGIRLASGLFDSFRHMLSEVFKRTKRTEYLDESINTRPTAYASYWIDLNQLAEAIATLESGRALLWPERRHLRAPVDQFVQANPQLGHKLAAVNRDRATN